MLGSDEMAAHGAVAGPATIVGFEFVGGELGAAVAVELGAADEGAGARSEALVDRFDPGSAAAWPAWVAVLAGCGGAAAFARAQPHGRPLRLRQIRSLRARRMPSGSHVRRGG